MDVPEPVALTFTLTSTHVATSIADGVRQRTIWPFIGEQAKAPGEPEPAYFPTPKAGVLTRTATNSAFSGKKCPRAEVAVASRGFLSADRPNPPMP